MKKDHQNIFLESSKKLFIHIIIIKNKHKILQKILILSLERQLNMAKNTMMRYSKVLIGKRELKSLHQ